MEIRRWGIVASMSLWTLSTSTLPAGAATPEILSAQPPGQATGSNEIQYTVLPGDTLWDIANRFHTRVERLQAMNSSVRPHKLPVGARLTVPRPSHSVQPVMADAGKLVITARGEQLRVRHVLNCKLTAYTSGYESTGKRPGDPGYGITSSGRMATVGRTIAVDPDVISIGSKVYIEGVGIRYAEDTGGAVKGPHIDIYLGDDRAVQEAIQFGVKQNVPVYILEE